MTDREVTVGYMLTLSARVIGFWLLTIVLMPFWDLPTVQLNLGWRGLQLYDEICEAQRRWQRQEARKR